MNSNKNLIKKQKKIISKKIIIKKNKNTLNKYTLNINQIKSILSPYSKKISIKYKISNKNIDLKNKLIYKQSKVKKIKKSNKLNKLNELKKIKK